jgi:triosephosphate isomerase
MTQPRRPLIAGNWKMNTSRAEAVELAHGVAAIVATSVDVVVCPPFPWLVPVADALSGSRVHLGAQDCWPRPNGAYTGGVSLAMLGELVTFVIVGHSERRHWFGETDDLVRDKVTAVIAAGLTPIVCVGESLETRDAGDAETFVAAQVRSALADRSTSDLERTVIAYEPIWAIGTGRAASASDAEAMAAAIRSTVNALRSGTGEAVRILYGGSVTPANAEASLRQPNVDGALVGGASLNAEAFAAIVRAVVD